jgi:predicted ATPase
MIEMIRIRNFKSLGEVHLPVARFNCLIGMNGAGKSTVLQVFDFLSHIMQGDVRAWLDERNWSISDLNCKLRKESNIHLGVDFLLSTGEQLFWNCVFNRSLLRCVAETVFLGDERLMHTNGQQYFVPGKARQEITFTYEGSLLAVLKESELPPTLLEFRRAMQHIRSLELLSPQLLRKRAKVSDHDIGQGGEKLSAFLDNIVGERKTALTELLKKFYPTLVEYKVSSLRSGWKKLSIIEQFGDKKLETEASHLNDGLLRILAVLAQAGSDRSLILLDEIENGINQEIIEPLVDTLVASQQQMLITTHSPLILNYMTDEVARQSVQFIYKTPDGESRIRPFFEIPRIGDKLRSMGPGDAFVDTNLRDLSQECVELDRQTGTVFAADL